LRPAVVQLDNRQQRFTLRLLSLPKGDMAKEVVGALTWIGRRLTITLNYSGAVERMVLPKRPTAIEAELVQEEEAEAMAEAVRVRPGLTMFTDGSRLDSGATGYTVVWRNGESWGSIKTHMSYNQEAYDVESAALA